jgi:hypothetical protein
MQIFQEIENSIYSALQETKEIGVKSIDFYAGQLAVKDLSDYAFQYPFIYIGNAALKLESLNRRDKGIIEIGILSGDRNIRGSQSGKLGDQSSPGVYAITQKIYELLQEYKTANNTSGLFMRECYPLAYEESMHICIYVQNFETKISIIRN